MNCRAKKFEIKNLRENSNFQVQDSQKCPCSCYLKAVHTISIFQVKFKFIQKSLRA